MRAICRLEGVGDQIRFVSVVERGDGELEFVRDLSGRRLAWNGLQYGWVLP